ncbi:SRPBCC family protein [Actinoplanes sp. TFC3]|uniref:SRPBCC family protein n=1 Tax=Actinoplanes sp. TFC3 TaxID=1710355 RepID=UPI0009EC3CF5|nr:SRPBCC family protein [Actinoplanes sp. TFC3]
MTSTRKLAVAAPAGAVLEYLRDYAHTADWDLSTRSCKRIDTGPIVPGSWWRHESKVLGITTELDYTLVTENGDRLAFTGRGENATATDVITVTAGERGGSEITYHAERELHGLAKLATPVLRVEFEKLASASVQRLTGILDHVHQPFM